MARFQSNFKRSNHKKSKCHAIISLEPTKTFKQLRSFMGCFHHSQKSCQIWQNCHNPLGRYYQEPIQRHKTNLTGMKTHRSIWWKKTTNSKYYRKWRFRHWKTYKSKIGLGACLDQKYGCTWEPVAYASRFLKNLEERYSTNELELLAVVWSLEYFKNYLYGSQFFLQTDHQGDPFDWPLIDRLLPFNFAVGHVPGKNMSFADYLSRNPTGKAPIQQKKTKIFASILSTIYLSSL